MLQKLQIHVSALPCRLYLTLHVCLLIFAAQSTKKRTQFCPKVSQRTFHEDDPPEIPFVPKVMAHKNIRNGSPEEENQMPASKRPRHWHRSHRWNRYVQTQRSARGLEGRFIKVSFIGDTRLYTTGAFGKDSFVVIDGFCILGKCSCFKLVF